jgi:F0F1-type ATP synthase delta subunit
MEKDRTMYIDIFKVIHTKSEAQECIDQINALLATLYIVTGKTLEEQIHVLFTSQVSDVLMNIIQKQSVNIKDLTACRTFFVGLERTLKEAKVVELTLGVQMDSELLNAISSYLRDILSQQEILLSVKIDSGILGGAEIIWNGKYLDFSLKKQIDDWFLSQQQVIRG